MHQLRLRHRAPWQLRLLHLSHQLRKPHLWLPKQQNQLKPAFLAGSRAFLVPARPWLLHLCVLLPTNAKVAQRAVLMAAQAVMVNVLNVLKAKASAVMAVAMKAVQKDVTHAEAAAVSAMAQNADQSVVQSAVTKHVLKVVLRVAQKVVAHVTPTARMVVVHVRKPVQTLKAG